MKFLRIKSCVDEVESVRVEINGMARSSRLKMNVLFLNDMLRC